MLTKQTIAEMKAAVLQANNYELYCGLIMGTPSINGDNAQELAYAGYARQALTFSDGANDTPNVNENGVVFPKMNAGEEATTVSYVGFWDAETGGNLKEFFQIVRVEGDKRIPTTYPIGQNSTVEFGVNSLEFGNIVNTPCKPASNCGSC